MPYRVLNNADLNDLDRKTDKRSYALMVETALNVLEDDGYRLIAIEEGDPQSTDGPYYIMHKQDSGSSNTVTLDELKERASLRDASENW